eukprot:CAMPEP_0182944772 /NCGR_PEP_ID=MMETSP0105_2-20130417/54492_1 /TAXON_ID=81532 ORGANISM="Acanthoeca-like sp., Strain 10tr" /NCGR_SAMPLE_ID=MMETSP0105_2 /ASSEMBLY_ACC=CAM_ASM_000205 /LENGTH=37 /DNA_ID= /DNA_START= /DNA_END= /DNA_ORIENTATION=
MSHSFWPPMADMFNSHHSDSPATLALSGQPSAPSAQT